MDVGATAPGRKEERATGIRRRAPRGDGVRAAMRKRATGGAAEERWHKATGRRHRAEKRKQATGSRKRAPRGDNPGP